MAENTTAAVKCHENQGTDNIALGDNIQQGQRDGDDPVVNTEEADRIAAKLIGILVEGFTSREQRKPSDSELDELLAELTEERINAMLGGPGAGIIDDKCTTEGGEVDEGCGDVTPGPEANAAGSDEEDEDNGEEEEEEEEDEEDCHGGDENDASSGNKRKGSKAGLGEASNTLKKPSQPQPVFSWPVGASASGVLGQCPPPVVSSGSSSSSSSGGVPGCSSVTVAGDSQDSAKTTASTSAFAFQWPRPSAPATAAATAV